jgi:hypothetical protein
MIVSRRRLCAVINSDPERVISPRKGTGAYGGSGYKRSTQSFPCNCQFCVRECLRIERLRYRDGDTAPAAQQPIVTRIWELNEL